MNLERLEEAPVNNYEQYRSLDGIINETDYASSLARAKEMKTIDTNKRAQVQTMATASGIILEDSGIDPRVALYAVLRADQNPDLLSKYHHSQMTDQKLFAEVLRMLGDTESLKKLLETHPHIFPEGK
jgi:hypothetical protein